MGVKYGAELLVVVVVGGTALSSEYRDRKSQIASVAIISVVFCNNGTVVPAQECPNPTSTIKLSNRTAGKAW